MSELVSIHRASSLEQDIPCIIMLHGYGSNEQDLFSFAHYLPKEFAVYSLQAPYQSPFGGYAWFHLDFTDSGISIVNPDEVVASAKKVLTFINELPATINKERLVLLGFSQGTVLSFDCLLHADASLSGVIALSGFLAKETIIDADLSRLKHKKIFIGHGTDDPVIPVSFAQETKSKLNEIGNNAAYHEYPTAHSVTQEEFEDFVKWLSNI